LFLRHPLTLLAFSANISIFVTYTGYSATFFLALTALIMYALRAIIVTKIDKVTPVITIIGVFVLAIGLVWIENISITRVVLATLATAFTVYLSNLHISQIDILAREYVRKSQYLLVISFLIYLASIVGVLDLNRFISFGGRFAGFSFENVEHVVVCAIVLLIVVSSRTDHAAKKHFKIVVIFLVSSMLLAQSNMLYVVALSWFQVLAFRYTGIRHQSALLIISLAVSTLVLNELLYLFIPSVRGGGSDIIERFRGAEQLLRVISEKAQFFSIEFFQLERTCLASTGTNNFGFLNVYCDFGAFGLIIMLSGFFILERYLSCKSRQGFYLSMLAFFCMNAILIVPYYYSPTIIFGLIYSVRKLSQEKFKSQDSV